MERYFYENGFAALGTQDINHTSTTTDVEGETLHVDTETESVDIGVDGFLVFDRRHGSTSDRWIAIAADRDVAEMIVDALNTRASLVDSVDR